MKVRSALDTMVPYQAGLLVPGKLKLASNENPLGPSPLAIAAFQAAAPSLSLYPDGGARALREAIAKHHKLTNDYVFVGNGSDEVIVMLAATFVNPGDRYLVGQHTFSEYRFAGRLFDTEPELIPMPHYSFELDLVCKKIKPDTRMLFLCSPNNPSGTLISIKDLEQILHYASADTLVVLDAAYADFALDQNGSAYLDEASLLEQYPNLIILHTFSKLYGLAGLRIGYALARPSLVQHLEKVRQPFNVSLPAQAAAIAALNDHEFVQTTLKITQDGRQYLYKLFDELGSEYIKSSSNFVCFRTEWLAKTVFETIMQEGVTVRALGSFGMPDWIRVTVGTKEQLDQFAKALHSSIAILTKRGEAKFTAQNS